MKGFTVELLAVVVVVVVDVNVIESVSIVGEFVAFVDINDGEGSTFLLIISVNKC